MLFRKKKDMVDVRELQRRGVVRIPQKDIVIPTNSDGFVEFGKSPNASPATSSSAPTSNTELFGFADMTQPTPSTSSTPQFSSETDGYSKREVDVKITELDNKVYKLENRIELLEKKLDINQSADSNVGVMGW